MAAESKLEAKCRRAVEVLGGRFPKWTSPGNEGVPDRILLLKNAPAVFVELKAPGGRIRDSQIRWHNWLRRRGYEIWVVDSFGEFTEKLDAFIVRLEERAARSHPVVDPQD